MFRFIEDEIDEPVIQPHEHLGIVFEPGSGALRFPGVGIDGVFRLVGDRHGPRFIRLDLMQVFRIETADLQMVVIEIHGHEPDPFPGKGNDGAAVVHKPFRHTGIAQSAGIDGSEFTLPDAAFILQRTMGMTGERDHLRETVHDRPESCAPAAAVAADNRIFRVEVGHDEDRFHRIAPDAIFQNGDQFLTILFRIVFFVVGAEPDEIIAADRLAAGIFHRIVDRFAKIFERLILGLAAYIGMGPEIVVPGTVDQLRHLVPEIFFHQIVIVCNGGGIIAAVRQVSCHQDHIHLLFREKFQHIFAVVHTPVALIGIALHIAEDPDFQIWCSAHLS